MADVSIVLSGAADQDGAEDGPFYLTNGPGWSAVLAWAKSPGAERFPRLRELAEKGSVEGTDALGIELAAASVLVQGSARGVLEQLAEYVGLGDAEETLTVTTDD